MIASADAADSPGSILVSSIMPLKQHTLTDYQRRIEAVVDHIRADPSRAHTVRELAGLAAFSEFHFHRVFRAVTGESVAQCIIRLRLERAASALIYTPQARITQIALDGGFSSSANFSKAFSKAYGCSPSRYRRQRPVDFRLRRIGKALPPPLAYPEGMSVDVDILNLPDRSLASLRLVGPYRHEAISQLYADLGAWHEATLGCPTPDRSISITWSDSALAEEETWRLDACYEVPQGTQGSGKVVMRPLTGGRTACLNLSLATTQMHRIADGWDWLFSSWLPEAGVELADRPAYEIYQPTADRAGYDITLCLPLTSNRSEHDHV